VLWIWRAKKKLLLYNKSSTNRTNWVWVYKESFAQYLEVTPPHLTSSQVTSFHPNRVRHDWSQPRRTGSLHGARSSQPWIVESPKIIWNGDRPYVTSCWWSVIIASLYLGPHDYQRARIVQTYLPAGAHIYPRLVCWAYASLICKRRLDQFSPFCRVHPFANANP